MIKILRFSTTKDTTYRLIKLGTLLKRIWSFSSYMENMPDQEFNFLGNFHVPQWGKNIKPLKGEELIKQRKKGYTWGPFWRIKVSIYRHFFSQGNAQTKTLHVSVTREWLLTLLAILVMDRSLAHLSFDATKRGSPFKHKAIPFKFLVVFHNLSSPQSILLCPCLIHSNYFTTILELFSNLPQLLSLIHLTEP